MLGRETREEAPMSRTLCALAAAVWLCTCVLPVAAQSPPAGVAEQLAQLNLTMTRIAAALEAAREREETGLLLERAALAAQRLAALEEELRRATGERTGLENEQFGMARQLRQLEESPAENPDQQREIDRMTEEVGLHLRLLRTRLEAVARRGGELEGRIEEQRAVVSAWQDAVDRRLARLP
jgi:uncharacterized membrane protein YccC